ncbi:hypothetical protein AJ80_04104 [Polytolypa hystricis UAMH7299]|uniref:Sugar phosphate transporter domain-containing protein n=1 Tax=Polytolypa hystricis (strain UAMH7299) TaxID=1447883 RepID=A0A2B7YDT2_POLH7|nr:hypothetical protein AJ80_04104 [Polytolypa hystricis UAMH7299]
MGLSSVHDNQHTRGRRIRSRRRRSLQSAASDGPPGTEPLVGVHPTPFADSDGERSDEEEQLLRRRSLDDEGEEGHRDNRFGRRGGEEREQEEESDGDTSSMALDDLLDDEEVGLTPKERRQRWRQRKRQRRELDARVLDDKTSDGGRRLADLAVVRKLAVNGLLIASWYIFAVSISVYNTWMFSPDHLDFSFPLFATSIHMLVQFILASTMLYLFPKLRPRLPSSPSSIAGQTKLGRVITPFFYITRLVPCGTATSLDIGLGNMSLKFISLSFLTMCKSSALAFVLLFAFIFRLETPSMKLIFVIAIMTVGVVMMVAGEAAFHVLGFSLIIASAFFSGFRWALTQILLLRHPATANPFSTLFFLTPIMFVSLIIIALSVEGASEIAQGLAVLTQDGLLKGILILLFPGTLAFFMIASEFALLQRSSVVTLSICGIFKEAVTIGAGGMIYDDKLTAINISGLLVTMSSIGWYNYMKVKKMRAEARMDVGAESDDDDDDDDDLGNAAASGTEPRSLVSRLVGATFGAGDSNEASATRYQPLPLHSNTATGTSGPGSGSGTIVPSIVVGDGAEAGSLSPPPLASSSASGSRQLPVNPDKLSQD